MYMYVNKCVELAQQGIALSKIYVLLLLLCLLSCWLGALEIIVI